MFDRRKMLGVITPSSNTVLEPVTSAIVSGLPGLSAHFARFTVTQIALSDDALAQFDMAPMLAAARLLADAKVGVICWSGTSASWLGFDRDEALCDAITAETGIAACTSVLALNELIAADPGRGIGLVTPYTDDVQERIIDNYARSGRRVVAEAHAGISDNHAFADLSESEVMEMCRSVAQRGAGCIVVMCTNMRGAVLAEAVEREFGIPLYDSTSAVVWMALHLLRAEPSAVTGWGSLFRQAGGGRQPAGYSAG